jgi:protein-S-isoprenylcysteine O-methyltransferase Ste14
MACARGAAFIVFGWKAIHSRYWVKGEGQGELVTDGIHSLSRHPQYAGFILMTFGLLVHWATLPLLVMWPVIVFQYYRLAKREELELEKEFGERFKEYKEKVPMFLPKIFNLRVLRAHSIG